MGYLRTDNDYLNAQAAAACQNARWAEDDLVIEARYIAQLPAAIAPRAVRRLLEMMGTAAPTAPPPTSRRWWSWPGRRPLRRGVPARRTAGSSGYTGRLLLTTVRPLPPFCPPLALDGETEVEGHALACSRPVRLPGRERAEARGPIWPGGRWRSLVLRPRQTGTRLPCPGRGGTKTLKKLFIDERVPRRAGRFRFWPTAGA